MRPPVDAAPWRGLVPALPGAGSGRTRVLGIAASLGLGLVLFSLCGFAIWAAFAADRAADDVEHSSREHSAFDAAHYAVSQEESLERKYRLEPGTDILEQHRSEGAALVAALTRVATTADAKDQELAREVMADHQRYLDATARMFAAVDAHNTQLVNQIDADEVDPIFGRIQTRIESAYLEHEAEQIQMVGDLRGTDEFILRSTIIASIIGGILMLGFWAVLRSYQRHLDEASAAEKATLEASEARFRSLVQNSSDMIGIVDEHGVIRYQSAASERVLGLNPDDVVGVQCLDFVHPDDRERVGLHFADAMRRNDGPALIDARLMHGDGSWRHMEIVASNQFADAQIGGFVLNIRDISDRHDLEEQLRHQAFHDPLTGLANRARFMDRLEHELARSTRRGRTAAVLFLDLDDFKSVNDALGHPAGDELLVAAAERLSGCVRPGDTIARFGGDEFVVLLEEVTGTEEAMEIAERLIEALRPPFVLDAKEVFVRASIGVALSRRGLPRADELLRRADVAMYAAKARGKGRCEAYDPEMQASALERLTLTGDLQRAVEREEFVLRYQPLVELATGRIAGVEALIRWQHPLRGLLPPDDFIRLAEDTGLIIPIGRWVLNEACAQARRWQQAFPAEPPLTMAVNISANQIHGSGLNEAVWEALRDAGLDPSTLVLEITESVMMQHTEDAIERLRELKQLGVRLAVDDFGTGYSSLSYLQRFPIDVLKIDKSFVDGVGSEEKEAELAQAIVDMARALHMEIVAEGIERVEQLERLRQLRCDLGQGYYFAHPVDVAAIDQLLTAARPAAWVPAAEAA
ncbi:MAG: EAL domain-containing protein [Dehalococcoidia bacterium]|nr:MAG: EAL domain-containing protein [Dehalococcoidia bacterium]